MRLSMFGNTLDDPTGVGTTSFDFTRTKSSQVITCTRMRCERFGFGPTAAFGGGQQAYLICIELSALASHSQFTAGSMTFSGAVAAGSSCIVDLRQSASACYRVPFDSVQIHMPFGALYEVSRDAPNSDDGPLVSTPGVFIDDPILHALAQHLSESSSIAAANQILIDQALRMLRTHLVTRHGLTAAKRRLKSSGLAPWQQRLAKQILLANLSGRLHLREVASACHMSESAFVRSFSVSVGVTPHRWLTMRRIECSKELMRDPGAKLSEVALAAGFGDQPHFTRVFSSAVGLSPHAWRKAVADQVAYGVPRTAPISEHHQHVDEALMHRAPIRDVAPLLCA